MDFFVEHPTKVVRFMAFEIGSKKFFPLRDKIVRIYVSNKIMLVSLKNKITLFISLNDESNSEKHVYT